MTRTSQGGSLGSAGPGGPGGTGGPGGIGGIGNLGTVTISGSTLSGNYTPNVGGSIYNDGSMTVSDCTLSGNAAEFGGGISDLLLLVREAVLEAQIEGIEQRTEKHVVRSISSRAREYTRLIESRYFDILQVIDELRTPPSNSDAYRELIFKRLVLEYVCGTSSRVIVHPLVAATGCFAAIVTAGCAGPSDSPLC